MNHDIPDSVVREVSLSVYGPDLGGLPDRVEIVLMALTQVAEELHGHWNPDPVECPSRSRFGVVCELREGHPAHHEGHIGSTPAAWDDRSAL